eukprot:NODE_699_length_1501_cov_91.829890_g577_i0.p1 GENE.NODE_699_length_1501_cov_91.829890_g577_i0~~NODE_699_length_1501_cov_91.829890_g577_i0.p1  ORF type:complete len:188 (-),score=41.06 NODE_699_length_1501_cov_91.829890_g577_i0:40-603(-)
MINYEDLTAPVNAFLEDILKGQQAAGDKMPVYLHVGETHDRFNENVVDSYLLGSRRFGHGFQIGFAPKMVQKIVEKDICLECCPVSNRLLGYTPDLRNHPVRFMLNRGLQISVSSDDPCFFGYDGVTLDYLMLVLAWELDMRDLKKLSLNGIDYASIDDTRKEELKNGSFKAAWDAFIAETLQAATE